MMDTLKQTKAMPISLLLTGHPCRVVGGGKIALRKTGHLLDVEARVTVISPELCDEMGEWASSGQIQHVARLFEAADVEGDPSKPSATLR